MQLYVCTNCSNLVYFENRICENCGGRLGYDPGANAMLTFEQNDAAEAGDPAASAGFRFCDNAAYDACNWLIPADSRDLLCTACRHNQIIPDLSVEENLLAWRKLELAKHHLFHGLLRARLPLDVRQEDPPSGLAFEFLADTPDAPVLTGHQDGVITLNLAEADDATREKRRTELGEPYRTILGHLRHEIGHYYWDRLVRDGGQIDAFRECFGDERQDYAEALRNHYADGPPADWRERFVSAYASSHPWEDFAETWAHFLHIADTLEMAGSLGIRVNPVVTEDSAYAAKVDFNPYAGASMERLMRHWLPLVGAVNSLNRCMGQPDLYPFILTSQVIGKIGFVHELISQVDR